MARLPRDKKKRTYSDVVDKVITKGLILGYYMPVIGYIYVKFLYNAYKQTTRKQTKYDK